MPTPLEKLIKNTNTQEQVDDAIKTAFNLALDLAEEAVEEIKMSQDEREFNTYPDMWLKRQAKAAIKKLKV